MSNLLSSTYKCVLFRLPIWQILENCRLKRTARFGQILLEIGGKRCGNFQNVECSLSVAVGINHEV